MHVAPLLALLAGCAPAKLLDSPARWPQTWGERSLYATPNAYIYAARGAAAGEVDRLVARVGQEYQAEVGVPPSRLMVIVCDWGEPLPADDMRALLSASLRVTAERAVETPDDVAEVEAEVAAAFGAAHAQAAVFGTTLGVLLATLPLACDVPCLQEVVRAPEAVVADVDGALILPTQGCLRENVRRMMAGAYRAYGIGPVARVLFAPLMTLVEAKTVAAFAQLRDVALFEYWLFACTELSWPEKRELAAAYSERKLGAVEDDVASIVSGARRTAERVRPGGPREAGE
jgi:hypothetical protein